MQCHNFAKYHLNCKWSCVLLADGNKRLHKKKAQAKNAVGSLMLWGCFAASGPGGPLKINGIINRQKILAQKSVFP